jgi:hypothetical protein
VEKIPGYALVVLGVAMALFFATPLNRRRPPPPAGAHCVVPVDRVCTSDRWRTTAHVPVRSVVLVPSVLRGADGDAGNIAG